MAKRHYGMGREDRGDRAVGNPLSNTIHEDNKRYASGMISEDRSAPALLPQHVIERYWPTGGSYANRMEPDLFEGVQKSLKEDSREFSRAFKPGKY